MTKQDDLSVFCCQNGKVLISVNVAPGNLTVRMRYGKDKRIRLLQPCNENRTLPALGASHIQTIHLAYDNDQAGDKAAEQGSKRLSEVGIESYRVQFPKGMDANEYALKVQPAKKSLEMALETATKMDNKSDISGVLKPSPSPSINRDGHLPVAQSGSARQAGGKKDGGDFSTEETTKGEEPERAAGPINSHSEKATPSEEKPSQTSPQPSPLDAPSISPLVEVKDDAVYITLGDRVYRILELFKNNSSVS